MTTQITQEQLQEIKDRQYHKASTTEKCGWKLDTHQMFDDIRELIAALEVAQAELAEEKEWTIKYREAIIEDKAMAKQLTASQAEVERLRTENVLYAKHIDVLSPEKNDPR